MVLDSGLGGVDRELVVITGVELLSGEVSVELLVVEELLVWLVGLVESISGRSREEMSEGAVVESTVVVESVREVSGEWI